MKKCVPGRQRGRLFWGFCVLAVVMWSTVAHARPEGPRAFCETYPDSPHCAGTLVTCEVCHTSTTPGGAAWNPYGVDILLSGYMPPFEAGIVATLPGMEELDSDGDGIANLDEIADGTLPGDPTSVKEVVAAPYGEDNPGYVVDGYDAGFAVRRIAQVYCGRSITYEELSIVESNPDVYGTLHAVLDICLQSDYWKKTALARLADPAIRPIDFGSGWGWDYRLFRYVMMDGRDMRDLLLADYHVRELNGVLTPVEGVFQTFTSIVCDPEQPIACAEDQICVPGPDPGMFVCQFLNGGQETDPAYRAGMITSSWFHFYNTMFAAMPRQTAAQAYRAYLGMDIARMEGILPVSEEPVDYDQKGVQEAECAQCHSTLDPLSYPFAYYNGIGDGPPGAYNPDRPYNRGLWEPGEDPQGYLFNLPVENLVEWAEVAANSDPFLRKMALLFYTHAIGHAPTAEGVEEFDALWKSIPGDNYSADALNHRIIDLMAFGGP